MVNLFDPGQNQPPPQALRFSHGRGERETSLRVTGDQPQGTMGRVQTADVWVRGRVKMLTERSYSAPEEGCMRRKST